MDSVINETIPFVRWDNYLSLVLCFHVVSRLHVNSLGSQQHITTFYQNHGNKQQQQKIPYTVWHWRGTEETHQPHLNSPTETSTLNNSCPVKLSLRRRPFLLVSRPFLFFSPLPSSVISVTCVSLLDTHAHSPSCFYNQYNWVGSLTLPKVFICTDRLARRWQFNKSPPPLHASLSGLSPCFVRYFWAAESATALPSVGVNIFF